ncbi:hypothetical protein EDC32_102582 [Laceyella sacchari]|nr:hypothetical protein EDC32_102582 [Laceyella sacchari]
MCFLFCVITHKDNEKTGLEPLAYLQDEALDRSLTFRDESTKNLFMVCFAADDFEGTVDLLQEEDADQLMGKGHG